MRVIDCEQNSEEWLAARVGRATASEFSSVLAKGQGKTRASYLRRVAAERLTGLPTETFKNGHMDRGTEQEPFARAAYEITTNNMVDRVGVILHDDILAACSPDGLIGNDGGVEIKSVIPTTQLDTILSGQFPTEHKAQIQGNLWITERKFWDFVSFCPEMPEHLRLFIVRVYPDAAYIAELEKEVRKFLDDVDELIAKLPQAEEVAV